MIPVALEILSPTTFSRLCPNQIILVKEFIKCHFLSLVFAFLLRVSSGGSERLSTKSSA